MSTRLTPLLYGHLVLRAKNGPRVMGHFVQPDVVTTSFAKYLRTLLCSGGHADQLVEIIRICPKLSVLALSWRGFMTTPYASTVLALDLPAMRRLSIAFFTNSAIRVNLSAPLFHHLSHLYIVFGQDGADPIFPVSWEPLRDLSRLTHFGLQYESRFADHTMSYSELSELVVPHFPDDLQVAIIACLDSRKPPVTMDWLLKDCDDRVVVVECRPDNVGVYPHVLEREARAVDWGGAANVADWRTTYDQRNIWLLAEEMRDHNRLWRKKTLQ